MLLLLLLVMLSFCCCCCCCCCCRRCCYCCCCCCYGKTRCIARCGAGTNNCQVDLMTKYGVPVFNTPGSNANAVKELVLCSLFLASRGIIDGSQHMKKLHAEGVASERIEKDKALFGGSCVPCVLVCAVCAVCAVHVCMFVFACMCETTLCVGVDVLARVHGRPQADGLFVAWHWAGQEIKGKTLGVIGLGHIGATVVSELSK